MRERRFVVHEQVYDSSEFYIVTEAELRALLSKQVAGPRSLADRFDIVECLGNVLVEADIKAILREEEREDAVRSLMIASGGEGSDVQIMTAAAAKLTNAARELGSLRDRLENASAVAREQARKELIEALAKVMP